MAYAILSLAIGTDEEDRQRKRLPDIKFLIKENMEKYTLLSVVLFSIFFASCSKTLYYAWEGEKGGYCTLEVKKHQVIYRGAASLLLQSKLELIYMYLYGNDPEKCNNIKGNVLSINI